MTLVAAASALAAAWLASSEPAAAPNNHPNLGVYDGRAVVHTSARGPVSGSCPVVARLWARNARLQIMSCSPDQPFSNCSFPLEYIGRASLSAWKWRLAGSGRDVATKTCRARRSIPGQLVVMYGNSDALNQTFTVRARDAVLDTSLRHR